MQRNDNNLLIYYFFKTKHICEPLKFWKPKPRHRQYDRNSLLMYIFEKIKIVKT